MARHPPGSNLCRPMDRRQDAIELARRLESWGTEREWRGTDPYEGLNATRLIAPLRASPLGRRLLIQAVKRSPLDLRRLLGIDPEADAAAVALVASAYARNGFLDSAEAEGKLHAVLSLLERMRSPGHSEPCWGYHFEVQSRVVHYRRGEPNTIATAFGANALLDAHEALGDPSLLRRAQAVAEFFLRHIEQTKTSEGAYFGYHPGDRSPIHNSNMLACAVLARTSAAIGSKEMAEAAAEGLRYTVEHQRPDGSWPYGERADLEWVDNFHTGYVLDSLRACIDAGIGGSEAEHAWRHGLRFYRRTLFLADGTPKYFTTRVHPIDALSVAQGIQSLSIAARHDPACGEAARRVLDFALQRMLRRDGLPIFQRRRLWVNRALHVRWVVAPLLLALTHLIRPEGTGDPPVPMATEATV